MFFRKMQQNQALAKDQPCPLSIKSVDYREDNQSSQQGVLLGSTQHTGKVPGNANIHGLLHGACFQLLFGKIPRGWC